MDVALQSRAEQLASEMAGQARTIEDLNGLMRRMMKTALERMLNTEMDVHLGRKASVPSEEIAESSVEPPLASESATPPAESARRSANRRNGRSRKTVRADLGEMTIATPRDRDGTFEPQLVGKYQRHVPGFDEKILAMYAKGMTTRDIQELVQELYGVEVSPVLISEITADLDKEVQAWRTRPLEAVWPIVYFDGIVVHVRGANGRVSQHTMYVALGVNLEGHKELLGLWLGENEGAKFWLSVMTDMKNRGLRDIFVACIDGLSGFAEAIHAAYPQAKVQLCIVHLVRAALRYVSQPDSKAVIADLKKIYAAATVLEAEQALDGFRSSLGRKISDDCEDVADEVDRHHCDFRFSAADPQGDLHDQRHRIGEQRDSQVYAEPQDLSQRGIGRETCFHGDSRGGEEVDDADSPLERSPESLRHHV